MGYLSDAALSRMGFKRLGENVKISDKASIYNPEQIEIGDNSRIDDFSVVSGRVSLGRNVHVTVFCNIAGGEKGVFLGDFTTLAYGCHVFSQSDDYTGKTMTNSTIPDEYKNETKAPVYIKKHSIVGTGSVVFPGVVLEEGTSVGAMSLVIKSTESWSIYVGVPAKKIKPRCRDLLNLERMYLQRE